MLRGEEGGSPSLIGDVKLGLVLHLKQQLNSQWIESEEMKLSLHAEEKFRSGSDNIILLGRSNKSNITAKQLPIFSFLKHY
jgi:hypothetical protein